MTLEMIRQEEKEAGIQEGQLQKAIETAKTMKDDNIDFSTIAKYTGLSVEEIEKL